jgi:hypothetical protein
MPPTTSGPTRRAPSAATLAALACALPLAAPPAVAAKPVSLRADATSAPQKRSCRHVERPSWLNVGGRCRWRAVLRFVVGDRTLPRRATLVLRLRHRLKTPLRVIAVGEPAGRRIAVIAPTGARRVAVDATPALRPGVVRIVLRARGKKAQVSTARWKVPRLVLGRRSVPNRTAGGSNAPGGAASPGAPQGSPDAGASSGTSAPRPSGSKPSSSKPATAEPVSPAPPPPAAPPAPPPVTGTPAPPTRSGSVWVSPAELQRLPTSGAAWTTLKAAADGALGTADIADQSSEHDTRTLAAALVYARTGGAAYRAKAAAAITAAIGTERGGRTLALGRNLASYVIAADLVDLDGFDAAGGARFRSWLWAVRTAVLDGMTLVSTHELRPNNWGTMAGGSRIAADVYLGDTTDLARAAAVFAGFTGESPYGGFKFGDTSWQADPARPLGINPKGATKSGLLVDGALPDDMRRGAAFSIPAVPTGYPWEALQGVLVQADVLNRHGYPAWGWGDNAVLRAVDFLARIDALWGGWWAASDDAWQPYVVNRAYGTSFRTAPASDGKILGWTSWVYGG